MKNRSTCLWEGSRLPNIFESSDPINQCTLPLLERVVTDILQHSNDDSRTINCNPGGGRLTESALAATSAWPFKPVRTWTLLGFQELASRGGRRREGGRKHADTPDMSGPSIPRASGLLTGWRWAERAAPTPQPASAERKSENLDERPLNINRIWKFLGHSIRTEPGTI